LFKGGGAQRITEVPYGNPWMEERGDACFWDALQAKLEDPEPPALVYLVHPHFPTGFCAAGFADNLARVSSCEAAQGVVFLVDQCYRGFVEGDASSNDDDFKLEEMAIKNDCIVLVRSLSKVEGLAGVRLGYTVASPRTTKQLAVGQPFGGDLYISEIDLAGAVAALVAPDSSARQAMVRKYYSEERVWLSKALTDLGFEVTPSVGPYGTMRGLERVLRAAMKEGGAQLMIYKCPTAERLTAEEPLAPTKVFACFLVSDRRSNERLVEALRKALEADGSGGFRLPWFN